MQVCSWFLFGQTYHRFPEPGGTGAGSPVRGSPGLFVLLLVELPFHNRFFRVGTRTVSAKSVMIAGIFSDILSWCQENSCQEDRNGEKVVKAKRYT